LYFAETSTPPKPTGPKFAPTNSTSSSPDVRSTRVPCSDVIDGATYDVTAVELLLSWLPTVTCHDSSLPTPSLLTHSIVVSFTTTLQFTAANCSTAPAVDDDA
jgi:hypothetical protein